MQERRSIRTHVDFGEAASTFPPMTAVTLAVLALVLAAPVPSSRKAVHAEKKVAVPKLEKRAPLTEADVRRLLREWTVFDAAMATLQNSVPQLPDGGASPGDLERAEAAWVADERIRRTLESAGTDPETFLGLYRNVAEAWWALVESEAREHTAAGFRREIDALRAAKSNDDDGENIVAELERGLKTLDAPRADPPDLEVVRKHRADLAKIFSPEAPGP